MNYPEITPIANERVTKEGLLTRFSAQWKKDEDNQIVETRAKIARPRSHPPPSPEQYGRLSAGHNENVSLIITGLRLVLFAYSIRSQWGEGKGKITRAKANQNDINSL